MPNADLIMSYMPSLECEGDVAKIKKFLNQSGHITMEKADESNNTKWFDASKKKGYLGAMNYHRRGVDGVIAMPNYDKWYSESLKIADDATTKTQKFLHDKELEWKQKEYEYLMELSQLKEEKYSLYLKWSEMKERAEKHEEQLQKTLLFVNETLCERDELKEQLQKSKNHRDHRLHNKMKKENAELVKQIEKSDLLANRFMAGLHQRDQENAELVKQIDIMWEVGGHGTDFELEVSKKLHPENFSDDSDSETI